MNKLVATLSLTTAVFGASTAYLAYRLHEQAADVTGAAIVGIAPAEARPTGAMGQDSTERHAPAAVTSPPGSAVPACAPASSAVTAVRPSRDTMRDTMLPHARQFLARFDDAARHAALIEETKTSLRRQYEPLRNRLELDNATFEQLLAVMAEQTLQPQEKYYRCIADPNCDLANFGRNGNIVDDRSAELMALLGPENMDEFSRYQGTLGERESVVQLRGRLNDANNLRDTQAEQLVAALSDERARFQKEAMQRGASVSGWGMPQLGMLYYSGDSNSLDQRFADAAQYSRRLHERAAAVLSPQQLAIFDQMQNELLAAMKATMLPPG
jgi:hypothetical protein